MTTIKTQIAFYAEEDVANWLRRIDKGNKTKIINEALKARMEEDFGHLTLLERVQQLEKLFMGVKRCLESKPWEQK